MKSPFVEKFKSQQKGARVLIKEVPDPSRYGVPEIKRNKIITIEEKPQNPKSNFCVTGIYMYDSQVFDFISTLKPSQRGELEITDVNNFYIAKNELEYDVLQGFWTDAGTFDSLKHACELVERNNLSCDFGNQ